MSDFEKVYDRLLCQECPPNEGTKKKVEGCFNALNDYGKEPARSACLKCWEVALKKMLILICIDCDGDQL